MTEINVFDKSSSFLNFDRDVEFTQLKGNPQHREVTREVQILSRRSIFVNFEDLYIDNR